MRVGIIGHRSWIASAIWQRYVDDGHEVVPIMKDLSDGDLSGFTTVFLIAGRGRPSEQEREAEVALVKRVMANPQKPRKVVYISSLAVEREPTPYSLMKLKCEQFVLERDHGYVVRPPVIFGPEQSPWADMLLPAIARADFGYEPLRLREPTRPFHIMSVEDVAHACWTMGHDGVTLTRVLNLYSNTITPLELVSIASPGLPVEIYGGWRNDWPHPPEQHPQHPRDLKPWGEFVRWHYSPNKIRTATLVMVEKITEEARRTGS